MTRDVENYGKKSIKLYVVNEPISLVPSSQDHTQSSGETRKSGLITLLVKDYDFCESSALVNKQKQAYPGGSLFAFEEKLNKNLFFVRETIIFAPPKVVYCFHILELKAFSKAKKRQTAYEAILRQAEKSLASLRQGSWL